MDFNILIGGAAGQGMDTFASVFSKVLQREGYNLYTLQDYMSRVRGGHNYFQIRFSNDKVKTHRMDLDGIIALNQETLDLHIDRLAPGGFILSDDDVKSSDERLITITSSRIAKEIGDIRTSSSVTLGALLEIFGLKGNSLEELFARKFDSTVAEQNQKAYQKGRELVKRKFVIPLGSDHNKMLLHSNEAIALGALTAGLKFYSAYPMTPSTSIMSYLTRKAKKAKIIAEQAEDEIAAINMAIGASYAGVRSMTSTSGGGFSLMVEALGLAGIAEIPIVIVLVQRPGPATGLPTRTEQSDLKFAINAAQGEFGRMLIALRNPDDAFIQTIRAFNIADKYQMPVILLGDQYLSDTTQTVDPFIIDNIAIDRHFADITQYTDGKVYKRYKITSSGISPRIIPGMIPGAVVNSDSDEHDEYGNITEKSDVRISMVDKRARKFELLKEDIIEPDLLGNSDMDVLLIAWGSIFSPLSEAIDILNRANNNFSEATDNLKIEADDFNRGTDSFNRSVDDLKNVADDFNRETDNLKFGALVFGDIWPLPQKLLLEKSGKAKFIINVEQNHDGQLASLIRETTGIQCDSSVLKYDGRPLSAVEIANKIADILAKHKFEVSSTEYTLNPQNIKPEGITIGEATITPVMKSDTATKSALVDFKGISPEIRTDIMQESSSDKATGIAKDSVFDINPAGKSEINTDDNTKIIAETTAEKPLEKFAKLETAWCPGCGNFGILDALQETLIEMNLNPDSVLLVGGIGQAAKTPQYLNANGFEGLHGRALPPAAAAKIANHTLKVIVDTGDGDSYGEGGNHFLHNIRRNVDISHFVHNNQIYALTKGQSSPTSDVGNITDFTPEGVINGSLNPVLTAIAMGAGFVARAYSGDKAHLKEMMKQAIEYNGYALVDILQPCVSFNKINTYAWYKSRVYKLEGNEAHDYTNKGKALEKAMEWGDKIPLGILYKEEKPSFTDHIPFLKDTTLLESKIELNEIKGFIEEFM